MSSATLTRTAAGRFAASPPVAREELYALWAVAEAEANLAYDAWSSAPGPGAYAVFVAARDRAGAAQDALAAA